MLIGLRGHVTPTDHGKWWGRTRKLIDNQDPMSSVTHSLIPIIISCDLKKYMFWLLTSIIFVLHFPTFISAMHLQTPLINTINFVWYSVCLCCSRSHANSRERVCVQFSSVKLDLFLYSSWFSLGEKKEKKEKSCGDNGQKRKHEAEVVGRPRNIQHTKGCIFLAHYEAFHALLLYVQHLPDSFSLHPLTLFFSVLCSALLLLLPPSSRELQTIAMSAACQFNQQFVTEPIQRP